MMKSCNGVDIWSSLSEGKSGLHKYVAHENNSIPHAFIAFVTKIELLFNKLKLNDAYLIEIMACRLVGAKPLS